MSKESHGLAERGSIKEGKFIKGGWNQGPKSPKPSVTPSPQGSSQGGSNSSSGSSSGGKSKGSSD